LFLHILLRACREKRAQGEIECCPDLGFLVARERFELSSAGPEPAMLDLYTTGLQIEILGFFVISLTLKCSKRERTNVSGFLLFHGIFHAITSFNFTVQSLRDLSRTEALIIRKIFHYSKSERLYKGLYEIRCRITFLWSK
jgi:hypothetical protein